MRVLMLSTDRTVLDAGSPARKRMEEYAEALGALSVIVMCREGEIPVIGERLSLYSTNSLSKLFYVRDAVRIGKKLGADVVSAQDPFETGLAGLRIAKSLQIPLHVQVHTDFLAPEFAKAHWPLNRIRLRIAARVLPRAARIRAVSARIKETIEKRFRPHAFISVLPIFVDIERFRNVPHAKHPRFKTTLLVISRLEKEKRLDKAIEALKYVRDHGIDAGLVIAGSGRDEARLRALANRLGMAEHIEWRGFVQDTRELYGMADAVLYPGAPYEGFGMGIVEALAAGVPILAEDVGIAREAGAEIAGSGDFGASLLALLTKGPPKGVLRYTPYANKEEYIEKFTEDLRLSIPTA